MNATEYTIAGALVGDLWWPIGEPASKAITYRFQRPDSIRPFINGGLPTIRDAAIACLTHEDGDFSSAARFTADTVLIATRYGRTHTTKRYFDLASFASLADLVSDDYAPGDDE